MNFPLRSVAVFCGARPGRSEVYLSDARRLGATLAAKGVRLIYGGGSVGLMGAVADAAVEGGGEVTGVIPAFLQRREVDHRGISELIVVETMHERKRIMFERSDAFIILAGGIGTLEELFEILSWRALGLHAKPMVVIDGDEYWKPLADLIERTIEENFAGPELRDCIRFVDTVDEALPELASMPNRLTGPLARVT